VKSCGIASLLDGWFELLTVQYSRINLCKTGLSYEWNKFTDMFSHTEKTTGH
jgi:hypothetical protein